MNETQKKQVVAGIIGAVAAYMLVHPKSREIVKNVAENGKNAIIKFAEKIKTFAESPTKAE